MKKVFVLGGFFVLFLIASCTNDDMNSIETTKIINGQKANVKLENEFNEVVLDSIKNNTNKDEGEPCNPKPRG